MSELYRDFIEDQFDRVVNAINNELPTPTQADIGKVVQVASDGGSGAEYVLDAVPNELPTPTTSDIDKVVKVISDGSGGAEYSLDNESQELPTPASTNLGKVATVVSDGSGGYEWGAETVPSELPTPTTADIGKFATVVSDGSGGAEYSLDSVPNELPTPSFSISHHVPIVVLDSGVYKWGTQYLPVVIPQYLNCEVQNFGAITVNFPSGFTRATYFTALSNLPFGGSGKYIPVVTYSGLYNGNFCQSILTFAGVTDYNNTQHGYSNFIGYIVSGGVVYNIRVTIGVNSAEDSITVTAV